jgi:hydroxymethylpyrimidine/phosphomethylpyrimidine kinase
MEFLRAQLDACFEDFRIGAVKLGMLANAGVIGVVADAMEARKPPFLILDPVMVATSGAKLLEDAALEALRTRLIPLASVLTPNLPEAELLLGHAITDLAAMRAAAGELLALGAAGVFLKGGHLPGDGDVVDLFADTAGIREITHQRLRIEAHGTGCTLASAIAANLCLGLSMAEACAAAADYVHAALRRGYRPGRGDIVVLDHFGAAPAR